MATTTGTDPLVVLQWAADAGRVILTADVTTMTRWAYQRMAVGKPMPGVAEVGEDLPVGPAIDDLELLSTAGGA